MPSTNTKPVHSIRFRGVSAAIFENVAKSDERETTYFKVALSRRYKDGDEWKSTSSFSRDDLPIVTLVTERAFAWILEAESKQAKEKEA